MADVVVEALGRRIGVLEILRDVTFRVGEGEFVTLLGPSGCGKSTTLNALAGLDRPTSGRITMGGRVLYDDAANIFVDARFRDLGLMFQSYALWPHMTVAQNLDFTLEIRKIRGEEARRRIAETLALVDMDTYAGRYPGELSGGQQQRVALARTLVYQPRVLLLDEPLSNLDAKLRDKAREWLRDLQQRTGVTTIYVTHDQTEALSLSDRIIVMEKGRIVQDGTPDDVYDRPVNPFVADFVGASNLLPAELTAIGASDMRISVGAGLAITAARAARRLVPGPVTLSIRPERVEFCATEGQAGPNEFDVDIASSSYQGARFVHAFKLGPHLLRAESASRPATKAVRVRLPEAALQVFQAEVGR
ncbi:ABC transporter ATP-binding protein [Aestuariivirga sp. YIM B02566]|uniref:ABC transporter ATP-binding protein n=1 Tax=Taklimakanibacter albus TaxID=2800327 RepID=A0ACC5RFH1_9HYPH|nr:ABC transporter ATP-binding protein [Aestuariivirga sp. YIM B02566]MBK1871339.1 ABC transporter ATP-binding protein [Aestuariivirga sp. YIM B02566]